MSPQPLPLPAADSIRMPAAAGLTHDLDDAVDEVLGHLARRYSAGPKVLVVPAPSREDLVRAAGLVLRAPDHGGLRPFRFVSVGSHQRQHLGELFAADAARRGHVALEVERARERAHNGPALVALVARIDDAHPDVPVHEQWISVGAALMNFLNGLHLMGYGAKTLSGASVRDARIQGAFCAPGETLVAWIVAGTPGRATHPKRLDDPAGIVSDW